MKLPRWLIGGLVAGTLWATGAHAFELPHRYSQSELNSHSFRDADSDILRAQRNEDAQRLRERLRERLRRSEG